MTYRLAVALMAIALSACSAHSPFIVSNTTDTTPSPAGPAYASHSNPVRIVSGGLPAGAKYQVIENIEVGRIWYGGSESVQKQMADRARRAGADAVINVKTWHQPSGFSWAAPHGSGQAVKLEDPKSVNLEAVPGNWF
jgi:hypothetical protein